MIMIQNFIFEKVMKLIQKHDARNHVQNRPRSLTIISLFFMIAGAVALGSTLIILVANLFDINAVMKPNPLDPLPFFVQFGIKFLNPVVLLASGIGILKAQNWARILYVVFGVFGILHNLATTPTWDPMMMVPSIILFGVVVYFLYRPNANAFFAKKNNYNP